MVRKCNNWLFWQNHSDELNRSISIRLIQMSHKEDDLKLSKYTWYVFSQDDINKPISVLSVESRGECYLGRLFYREHVLI